MIVKIRKNSQTSFTGMAGEALLAFGLVVIPSVNLRVTYMGGANLLSHDSLNAMTRRPLDA